MLFRKAHSSLGVDFGAGGVKVVELKKEKNRPVLFTYGFTTDGYNVHRLLARQERSAEKLLGDKAAITGRAEAVQFTIDEQEVPRYAAVLKQVLQQARVVSRLAVASLPVSAVFHTVVTLPKVKKEERDRMLSAEVKKLLPYPMDEMAVDSQAVPAPDGETVERIIVNAVPRALVAFYTKVFKQAGLRLSALEPESAALARALVGRDLATTMIIDMGAERTNFFIVDAGVPLTHHSIEIGGDRINKVLQGLLGLDPLLTEQVKQDVFGGIINRPGFWAIREEGFLPLFSQIIDPITKEIEYGFDLFLRQTGHEQKRPEKIVLSGGSARFPFFADYLAEKFKIKCYVGDPWGRVVYQEHLKPILSAIGPRLAVAIGVALRDVV